MDKKRNYICFNFILIIQLYSNGLYIDQYSGCSDKYAKHWTITYISKLGI